MTQDRPGARGGWAVLALSILPLLGIAEVGQNGHVSVQALRSSRNTGRDLSISVPSSVSRKTHLSRRELKGDGLLDPGSCRAQLSVSLLSWLIFRRAQATCMLDIPGITRPLQISQSGEHGIARAQNHRLLR